MSVSATEVKKLRDKTGAGMMDCKKALIETNGEIEKAIEYLRKNGIAAAQKRAGRQATEGAVMTYLHPGNRIGVMVEVNCETDFVAKTDDFIALVKNIAMQIAATNPIAITRKAVPQDLVDKEMDIFKEQALKDKKPPEVVEKIIQGKLDKYFQEVVLLEQNFVKDSGKTVKEYILEISGKLGEAMSIRRFMRFQLGEEF